MENMPLIKYPTKWYMRAVYIVLGLMVSIIIVLALFIKLDAAAAANFTDDILRPLIGDARVIALERVFFNGSDVLNRLKSHLEKPAEPMLAGDITPLLLSDSAVRTSNLDLKSVATTTNAPLIGEGQWHDVPLSVFPNQIVVADTFIRPDPARPYAFVTLVQMDMSKLQLWSVAGMTQRSNDTQTSGPGVVPKNIQNAGSLVAAFEGGFLYRDGHYGMIVGTTTYASLQNGLATIVGHTDGHIQIIQYTGQSFGNDVIFIRQNSTMLIENGTIEAQDSTNLKLWGGAYSGNIYTWRSGVGITSKGNLVYAAGNSLVPSTLALALQAAGAINAMQLDINPNWVRFNVFIDFKNGAYTSTPIMGGMPNGAYSYLHGYRKDFFYITKKK